MNEIRHAPAIVLTHGWLKEINAKTCHGLLRGSDRFRVLAVIDEKYAGQDAGVVMDGRPLGIPVFSSVLEYLNSDMPMPQYCVVGVAFSGGKLPADFRSELLTAIDNGLSVVCGLHTFLSDDPEMSAHAAAAGVQLIDVRKPKPRHELHFWSGAIYDVKTPRIAVLGTDTALGKRTTCRFLMEMCRRNGILAEMIYTGQTGWMQGYKHGLIFDSTVNDFISGEIERVLLECVRDSKPDLILIEGQSSLRNPSGPCGSEFLRSGDVKGVVLQHAPGRKYYDHDPKWGLIPPVETEIDLIKMYGAEVLAITLNEEHMEEVEMEEYRRNLAARTGLPVIRPLKEGVEALLPVIQAYMENKQQ